MRRDAFSKVGIYKPYEKNVGTIKKEYVYSKIE